MANGGKKRPKPLSGPAFEKALRHRVNTARAAVQEQVPFFRTQYANVPSEWKADDTRVTFADFAISEKIFAELRRFFPEDDYCSEESSPQDEILPLNASFAWVLDPIDGTNNYALGLPFCAISLALLHDGIPIYGVVYDYSRDVIIHGGPRHGLHDGAHRVSVKTEVMNPQSLVGMHFPLPRDVREPLAPLTLNYRVRSLGSATLTLAYAAVGKLDGVVDHRVKVWDIAAGHALMAAGGGHFHPLTSEPVFPLKEFHVEAPRTPYFAGSQEFCTLISGLLYPQT